MTTGAGVLIETVVGGRDCRTDTQIITGSDRGAISRIGVPMDYLTSTAATTD